jgi:hypothetical protein
MLSSGKAAAQGARNPDTRPAELCIHFLPPRLRLRGVGRRCKITLTFKA